MRRCIGIVFVGAGDEEGVDGLGILFAKLVAKADHAAIRHRAAQHDVGTRAMGRLPRGSGPWQRAQFSP